MSKCCWKESPVELLKNQTYIKLENIPLEYYNEDTLETAREVYNSAIQAQKKVYTIHGPFSEHKNKEQFPNIYASNNGNDFYISKDKVFNIEPEDRFISLILSGLHNNTVIIHGKPNHVLVRKSNNVYIDIKEGTISGLDILYSKDMMIVMPCHNYTNIEYGESIYFQAEISNISQLHFIGSLDIKINNMSIPINPFINIVFSKEGWYYKKQGEIPNLMIRNF